MIINPSVRTLTQGKMNRYMLAIATAKCARLVTNEFIEQKTDAEDRIAMKEIDGPVFNYIDSEIRDNKAVEVAVRRIAADEYNIYDENHKLIR